MKTLSKMASKMIRLCGAIAASSLICVSGADAETSIPGVSTDRITVGQTSALSGPFGDLGQELLKGARVFFDATNASGGINGRKIKLVSRDDGYDVNKAKANAQAFIDEGSVFCLFNTFGTPTNEAILPMLQSSGTPLIAPYTGALSLRAAGIKDVFNLRASYPDEAEHLIRHLHTIGVTRIAVVYQNNSFGNEILQGVQKSLKSRGLAAAWAASIEPDGSNAASVAKQAAAQKPEALLLGIAGKSAIEVIKTVNLAGTGLPIYALSVLATPANLRALGKAGRGVVITQVMPFPTDPKSALAREYQEAMARAGHTEFTHLSFEGYLNAKVMAEGFRRAGRNLTRASFQAAMNSMRGLNMGGLNLSFGNGAASGSNFVEITMVDSLGKLIK